MNQLLDIFSKWPEWGQGGFVLVIIVAALITVAAVWSAFWDAIVKILRGYPTVKSPPQEPTEPPEVLIIRELRQAVNTNLESISNPTTEDIEKLVKIYAKALGIGEFAKTDSEGKILSLATPSHE